MFTLTFETIKTSDRFGEKVRAVISSDDKGYPFVIWVGETSLDNLPMLKRMAKKALKEAQNEAA